MPALTVAELYSRRWQVELIYRWIKQHLRIKSSFETSENAVITQIWIAVSAYVPAAMMKKRPHLDDLSLYKIIKYLSVQEKAHFIGSTAHTKKVTLGIMFDSPPRLY